MKIAFIGVGNMGGAVARRLASGSFDVTVFDPDAAAVARCVDAGATADESAESAAKGVDVVMTSLPTPELVVETIGALLPSCSPGTVFVDVSTVDPNAAATVRDAVHAADCRFVACPLGKTPTHAETGDVPVFIGGDDDAINGLGELFDRISSSVYVMGSVEAATTFKLVSNLIGMANVAVLAEGQALAARAGIPADVFEAALADTGAASFQSQVRLPWIVARDYAPRFGVDLALKDLRLAIDAAYRWKLPVPVGSAALAQLATASRQGFGGEDVVAIAKVLDPEARAEGAR